MQRVKTFNSDYDLVRVYKALLRHEVEQLRKKANYYLDGNTVDKIVSSVTQNVKTIVNQLLDKGLLIRIGDKYTTMHAELIRKITDLSLRPGEIQVYEWRLLEPRETPLPNFAAYRYDDTEGEIAGYLERNNVDLGVARKAARALVNGLKALGSGLSSYQYKMIRHALQHQWPITLVLSAPTGSGKTLIFTIIALAYTLAKKLTRDPRSREPYVLLVYPRKALATDQLYRLIKLLYHVNKELEKAGLGDAKIDVGILDGDSLLTATHAIEEGRKYVRGVQQIETSNGNLECVYSTEDDTVECKVNGQPLGYRLVTDLRCDMLRRPPSILITNVWMLEEHIIRSKSNARLCNTQLGIDDILFNARLLVLDEAHVYKGFQQVAIASLVHRYVVELARRIVGMRLEEFKANNKNAAELIVGSLINSGDFAIILSSATITTVDEGCLSTKNPGIKAKFEKDIENFVRYTISPGVYRLIGDRRAIVSENYDCIETNSKDTRLTIVLILAPKPGVSASTLQQEVILTTLAWSTAFKAKTRRPIKFISFFDNKDELSRVYRWITDIIIRERCEHCDHLAIPDYNSTRPQCGVKPTLQAKAAWKKYIASVIAKLNVNINSLQQVPRLHNIAVEDIINAFYNNHEFWVTFPLNENIKTAADLVRQIVNVAGEVCKGREIIGVHHGDLDTTTRQEVERKFKKGELLGLLSTQTLELGIDINDVGVVIQFKPPRKAENFVQRIGRAGRSRASFYTTLGILVLSSIDTAYLIEDHAREQLFHVRPEKPPYSNYNMVLATTLRYILYVLSKYNDETQRLLAKAMSRYNIAIDKFADIQKILTRRQSLRQALADLHDIIESQEFRDTVVDLLVTMYQDSDVTRDMVLGAYNTILADIDSILRGAEVKVEDVYQILDYLRERVIELINKCIERMKSDIAKLSKKVNKIYYVKILERGIEEQRRAINNLLDELARKIEGLVESCNKARIGCEDINYVVSSLKELLETSFEHPIQVIEHLDKCREIKVDEINKEYPSCRKILSFVESLCTY